MALPRAAPLTVHVAFNPTHANRRFEQSDFIFRAPLKTYQDRDEYNFDFEQGDSAHMRAGSPSCADQRSSEPKVFRFERRAACCALAALLSPRQGFQPNRWRESLAFITANRKSRHMGGFQRCPLNKFFYQHIFNVSH